VRLLLFLAAALTALAAEPGPSPAVAPSYSLPPALAAARRIVVLGDSITYGGTYVDFVEAVVRLRAPDWRGEIIDLGLSSETVSSLSETGHAGPISTNDSPASWPRPNPTSSLPATA
jgi:hypothetical protein